jgi:hypothetical protein
MVMPRKIEQNRMKPRVNRTPSAKPVNSLQRLNKRLLNQVLRIRFAPAKQKGGAQQASAEFIDHHPHRQRVATPKPRDKLILIHSLFVPLEPKRFNYCIARQRRSASTSRNTFIFNDL